MKDDAGVDSYEICGVSESVLDSLLGVTSGTSSDGGISSFISKTVVDQSITLRSAPASGYEVVKLEVFPYNQVCMKSNV